MERRSGKNRENPQSTLDLSISEIVKIVLKHVWFLIIFVSLPVLSTLFYLKAQHHYYQAEVSILLEAHQVQMTDISDVLTDMKFDNLTVPTQVEVLNSPTLARATISRLGLRSDKNGLLFIPDEQSDYIQDPADNNTLRNFLSNLSVKQQGTTRVIGLSFKSDDPSIAALVVNTHANEYIEAKKLEKKKIKERLDAWLSEEITKLKEQTLQKSRLVQQYRADNNMVFGLNSQELIYEQLTDVSAQFSAEEARVLELEAQNETLSESGVSTDVVSSKLIQDLKAQASLVSQKIGSLQIKMGPSHPELVSARQELAQINSDIQRETENLKKSVANELKSALKKKEALNLLLTELKTQSVDYENKAISLQSLQMEEQSSKKLLDNFLARSEEIKSQIDFTKPDVTIISLADIPGDPVGSKKVLISVAVTAFFLFLGLVIIFLYELLDQTIKTEKDVYKHSRYQVIGVLPRSRTPISDVLRKGRSLFNEEIKRIFVQFNELKKGSTILITSGRHGEGKTTCSAAMAYYMNSLGLNVLLIDTNVFSPDIAGLSMVNDKPGFYDLLSGASTLDEAVVQDKNGLSILPIGTINPSLSDLLLAGKFDHHLKVLKAHYDFIIFDGCPLPIASDGEVLAGMVDRILIIIEWGKTRCDTLENISNILSKKNQGSVGIIINKVPEDSLKSSLNS